MLLKTQFKDRGWLKDKTRNPKSDYAFWSTDRAFYRWTSSTVVEGVSRGSLVCVASITKPTSIKPAKNAKTNVAFIRCLPQEIRSESAD